MNTINAREMTHWTQERRTTLLDWMVEQGYSPRHAASLVLFDDGTAQVELFVLTPEGKRQLDPDDPLQVKTVVINFTPTTPCPEPTSVD